MGRSLRRNKSIKDIKSSRVVKVSRRTTHQITRTRIISSQEKEDLKDPTSIQRRILHLKSAHSTSKGSKKEKIIIQLISLKLKKGSHL